MRIRYSRRVGNWTHLWSGVAEGRRLLVKRGKAGSGETIADRSFPDEKAAVAELKRLAARVAARGWKKMPWPEPSAAPPPAEPTVTVTSQIASAARKLKFADAGGSGVVVMPRALQRLWGGTDENPDGSTDCDRACAVHPVGTVKFGGGRALAIGNACSTAFHPMRGGGMFIQWQGADSSAGCLAAALSIPERAWRSTRVRFEVGSGDLVMFDNGEPGARVARREVVAVSIPRGVYRLHTVWDHEVVVRNRRNKVEETSIAALRLQRI